MRRLFVVFIAAVSSIALVQIASAAPVAPAWTGFYIGANFGGGWGNRNVDYAANDRASVFAFTLGAQPPATSFETSGALGGVQAGYNWQFNPVWLIGFETDFDWSGMKGSSSNAFLLTNLDPVAAPLDERIKWFGTVRARLGYLPVDNFLVYITGGLAYGRVDRSGSFVTSAGLISQFVPVGFNCGPGVCFAGSSSSVAAGWTLGGGLEYRLWEHFSLKAEYLYVSLDGKSLTETALQFTPGVTPIPSTFNANYSRTTFNVARLGLNWHF